MFKRCTSCGKMWADRNAFLADPAICIIGYQVNFEQLKLGYYLFNHTACLTTLAVHAAQFVDLYDGPIYSQSKTGGEDCGGHCLREYDLDPCYAECECAYVREIIQIIRTWPSCKEPDDRADRMPLA